MQRSKTYRSHRAETLRLSTQSLDPAERQARLHIYTPLQLHVTLLQPIFDQRKQPSVQRCIAQSFNHVAVLPPATSLLRVSGPVMST